MDGAMGWSISARIHGGIGEPLPSGVADAGLSFADRFEHSTTVVWGDDADRPYVGLNTLIVAVDVDAAIQVALAALRDFAVLVGCGAWCRTWVLADVEGDHG